MFWKCIQYTIHWDKIQLLKKFPSDKINGTKNSLFFLPRTSTLAIFIWAETVGNMAKGGKTRSFFGKFGVLCILVASVLRFALLPYYRRSTRLVSLKLCVGLSIFNSVSFLLKFILLFDKMHGLFDFKTS